MSLLRTLTILTVTMLSTSPVLAENSRHYLEFGLSSSTLNKKASVGAPVQSESDVDGGILKYGYDFNNWFAVEGHLGRTASVENTALSYTSGINYMGFAGARFNLRYDHFTLYALGGAGFAQIAETSSGTDYQLNKVGPAYGVGLDFYGSKSTSISVAYIQYIDTSDVDLSSLQLTIKFYFDKPKIQSRY